MNVNITGIYDNTVIVDSNLFDDVRLLQTGLSSLSDTLYSVVQGLPYEYANLTAFTILSNDYEQFKIDNNIDINNLTTSLSTLNTDITNNINNLTTSLSTLNVEVNNNFVSNTTLSTITDAIDNQFTATTTYIDEQIVLQQDYTDQEIEALRTEGYIQ